MKVKVFVSVIASLVLLTTPGYATTEECNGQPATIVGTPGPDILYGTYDVDVIASLAGDDIVYGKDSDDVICGDEGSDVIYGDGGGDGSDLFGGEGADELHGSFEDKLYGGPGDDLLSGSVFWQKTFAAYTYAAGPIAANLKTGVVTGEGVDTLVGIRHVEGSEYADTLIGDADVNSLWGLDGNDLIYGGKGWDPDSSYQNEDRISGGSGNDHLYGRGGPDTLYPGSGDDFVDGGRNSDFLSYNDSTSPVSIRVADGVATGAGIDDFHEVERFGGSVYDDLLEGDAGPNHLSGDDGSDKLYGRGGDDTLSDGYGNDHDELYGNRGDDTLQSSSNESVGDTVDGGRGMDQCYYNPVDVVMNCE